MHRRATVPARVNIIGEHTDYEGGLALPFAIDDYLVLDVIERENGFLVWFHVASVGEAMSVLPLIENLEDEKKN